MWSRSSGKKKDTSNDTSSQSNRRNEDDPRSTKHRSGSGPDFVVAAKSNKKSSSRGDERDRGFNPKSTSYSSTTQSADPGTASASVASSYATVGGRYEDETYIPPVLVRNTSLADQMPKTKSSRCKREEDDDQGVRSERRRRKEEEQEQKDNHQDRSDKRDKRDKKEKMKDQRSSRHDSIQLDGLESSRGPAEFPDQLGGAGFSQFPGQYDASIPGLVSSPPQHPPLSSHVQDQFPGQFPSHSSEPYHPAFSTSGGGPGLAAEYYGDTGQSVHEQPGFRMHSPSLIFGAEPHLLPASVEANPPPEPSASGGVGAAASFFNEESGAGESVSTNGQPASSTYHTASPRINAQNSPSTSAVPAIGVAAMGATGAAAGYFMGSQDPSHQQHLDDVPSVAGAPSAPSGHPISTYHRPPSQIQESYYSNSSRPPAPGKTSSHHSNIPLYAAGAAGAASLAAASYEHSHRPSAGNNLPFPHDHQDYQYSHPPSTPMAHRHRHRGPLGAVVNFFKDPEGVAEFEEYSEIIGTCRYCFAPDSSPRDAPRKHHYRKRRSNERLYNNTRVDKDSRYYTSENENRRNKNKSWLATGLAGYGLGKVGETLFMQQKDFDDTYSVKTGRDSPKRMTSHTSRRRSRSHDRVETGITGDDKIYKRDPHGGSIGGPEFARYSTRRRSRSRSRDRKSKNSLSEDALGANVGASVSGLSHRRRSQSPNGAFVRTKHKTRSRSPEKRRKSHKKKKEKGFFGFGGSSSSSSVDLTHDVRHLSSKRSKKSKEDQEAEAALLGLGAAAAALAVNNQAYRKKGVKQLVGVKETKDGYGPRHDYKSPYVTSKSSEDEDWESALEEDGESVDSALAFGAPARRGSRGSVSSESSGTSKWGWRWGSRKERRRSPSNQKSSEHSNFPAVAGAVGAGLAESAIMSPDRISPGQSTIHGSDSTGNVPLQHVYPIATSDPSHFDVERNSSVVSAARPAVVPIQQPQPITPVSASLYGHSSTAPTGLPVFSQPSFQPVPKAADARSTIPEYGISGSFPQHQTQNATSGFKLRRRDTSPARFGTDIVANSMTPRRQSSAKDDTSVLQSGTDSVVSPSVSRRQFSTKEEASGVRFEKTEEQEEQERRERRRKRKEEKRRLEAEEEQRNVESGKVTRDQYQDEEIRREQSPEHISKGSWALPAAAGVFGAAIGAVAASERSKSEESREERRERRRREREEEAAADEEKTKKRERRRRERELEREKDAEEVRAKVSEDTEPHPEKKGMSVWQEAASAKRSSSHESYGDFFTPTELRNRTEQVKITSANPDADIDLDWTPNIIEVAPKSFRDPNALPEFSKADTDDKIDLSKLNYPWKVPSLRLVEPTPPSTRGSTPIIQPKDVNNEDVQPIRQKTPSKVTWGDDQTHEYQVTTPLDERDDPVEAAPAQQKDQYQKNAREEQQRLAEARRQQDHPRESTEARKEPASYGNDLEFAAALAAGAEDAGFDPSVVIDDPAYRRRDSPPGSNDRSMPGGFDDEDVSTLSKMEKKKKKKEKAARRRSEENSTGRDDDAIVKDIVDQLEKSEPRASKSVSEDGFSDEQNSGGKSKPKRVKAHRKDSESGEDLPDPENSMNRNVYETPVEYTQPVLSGAAANNDGNSRTKSRKKSKRDSGDYDDAASTVSSRSTGTNNSDRPKEKRTGSLWSRVLGKPTIDVGESDGTDHPAKAVTINDSDESKKKSKKSKARKSIRDELDDDVRSQAGTASDKKGTRRSNGDSDVQDSGRTTQDLPTKAPESNQVINPVEAGSVARYLAHNNGGEQQSESFLGMRPEPPPPPDIRSEEREPPDLAITALSSSSPSSPDQRIPVQEHSPVYEALQSPPALPSPTAIPFRFPRPRPPVGTRSVSQTPSSSSKLPEDASPRRPRPRSTQFESSKEFRPLWLVERHNALQDFPHEEIYPSLPSSHSTSRASSVNATKGHKPKEPLSPKMVEAGHQPPGERLRPPLNSVDGAVELDLLDSQQGIPTAASFHKASAENLPSSIAERASFPDSASDDTSSSPRPTLKDVTIGAVMGGVSAVASHGESDHKELPSRDLSHEENEQFQQASEMFAAPSKSGQADDPDPESNGLVEGDMYWKDDFAPQPTKKSKKKKQKARKIAQDEEQDSAPQVQAAAVSSTHEIRPDPEESRRLQEDDAQNAVDSWFEQPSSKKDEENKQKGDHRELQEELEATLATTDTRQGALEYPRTTVEQDEKALTQGMSRDQIPQSIVSATQSYDGEDVEVMQPKNETPAVENTLERRQSKTKGKKGKKSQQNISQAVITSLPTTAVAEHTGIVEHFKSQERKDKTESLQNDFASSEAVEPAAKPQMTTSPHFEPPPTTTPYPTGVDGVLRKTEQGDLGLNKADRPISHPQAAVSQEREIFDAYAEPESSIEYSQDPSTAAERGGTSTAFDLPSDEKGKEAGTIDQNIDEDDIVQGYIDIQPNDKATDTYKSVEGDWATLSKRKTTQKNKKSKKGFKIYETPKFNDAPEPATNTLVAQSLERDQELARAEESSTQLPRDQLKDAGDEWSGFSTGEDSSRDQRAGEALESGVSMATLATGSLAAGMATFAVREVEGGQDAAESGTEDTLKENSKDDDWTGFNTRKKGKKGKKQESKPFDMRAPPQEMNPAGFIEESTLTATTSTSKEAIDLLSHPKVEAFRQDSVDESALDYAGGHVASSGPRLLQRSEIEIIAPEKSSTSQPEGPTRELEDVPPPNPAQDSAAPNPSQATTKAAEDVQNILRNVGDVSPVKPAQDSAASVPSEEKINTVKYDHNISPNEDPATSQSQMMHSQANVDEFSPEKLDMEEKENLSSPDKTKQGEPRVDEQSIALNKHEVQNLVEEGTPPAESRSQTEHSFTEEPTGYVGTTIPTDDKGESVETYSTEDQESPAKTNAPAKGLDEFPSKRSKKDKKTQRGKKTQVFPLREHKAQEKPAEEAQQEDAVNQDSIDPIDDFPSKKSKKDRKSKKNGLSAAALMIESASQGEENDVSPLLASNEDNKLEDESPRHTLVSTEAVGEEATSHKTGAFESLPSEPRISFRSKGSFLIAAAVDEPFKPTEPVEEEFINAKAPDLESVNDHAKTSSLSEAAATPGTELGGEPLQPIASVEGEVINDRTRELGHLGDDTKISPPIEVPNPTAESLREPVQPFEAFEQGIIGDRANDLDLLPEDDFLPLKSKKDRKKSKKPKVIRSDTPITGNELPEEASAVASALQRDDDNKPIDAGAPETVTENRRKSKKDRKKAKKSQSLSWDEEEDGTRERTFQFENAIIENPETDISLISKEPTVAEQEQPSSLEHLAPLATDLTAASRSAQASLSSQAAEPEGSPTGASHVQAAEGTGAGIGINFNADADLGSPFNLKKNKRDKKKAKNPRSLTWAEEDGRQDTYEVSSGLASGRKDEPEVMQMPQDPKDWSNKDRHTTMTEPTVIVEPDHKTEEPSGGIGAGESEMLVSHMPQGEKPRSTEDHRIEETLPSEIIEPGSQMPQKEINWSTEGPRIEETVPSEVVKPRPQIPQEERDWSIEDRHIEEIVPSEVIEPCDNDPIEAPRVEEDKQDLMPPTQSIGLDPLLLIDREDDLAPARKTQKTKKPRKVESTLDVKVNANDEGAKTSRETSETTSSRSTEPVTEAEQGDSGDLQLMKSKKSKKDRKKIHNANKSSDHTETLPERQASVEDETSVAPTEDWLNEKANIETHASENQRDGDGEYKEDFLGQAAQAGSLLSLQLPTPGAVDKPTHIDEHMQRDDLASNQPVDYGVERTQRPSTDLVTPSIEVDLLSAQEQRKYDDAYQKELERQLSPPEDTEQPFAPRELEETLSSQPSIGEVMEGPFQDIQRPLAQPPTLEDIIEEPRSRPPSAQQENFAKHGDSISAFKPIKTSKKGRKGKKQHDPVIWEDETATPLVEQEATKIEEVPTHEPSVPGEWVEDVPGQPVDLAKPMELHDPNYENPNVVPSADEHREADDYFAIQSAAAAEENIGRDETDNNYTHSPTTPKAQSPRWDQHPEQVELKDENHGRDLPKSGETSAPIEGEQRDDAHDVAPTKRSQKSKKSEPKDPEKEADLSMLSSKEEVDGLRSQGFRSRSVSRERSSHSARRQASPPSKSRSRSQEIATAAAASLGLGTLAAEGLSRSMSVHGKKGKKSRKSWQFDEPSPPQSPASPVAVESTRNDDDLHSTMSPTNRDSAIHVADSPTVSDDLPVHRAVRDSGYPETETSPIIGLVPGIEGTRTVIKEIHPSQIEQVVIEEHSDDPQEADRRRSFIESDSEYDASRPIRKERRTRRKSVDSDDSNDSGFDIQRRRRRHAAAHDLREPSPVSSTTKERSSALFGSSPSAREMDVPPEQETPSRNPYLHEEPTWSFSHGNLPETHSQDSPEGDLLNRDSKLATETSTYQKLTSRKEPMTPFGERVQPDGEVMTGSNSPPSSDTRGRRRLNTISENGLEGSNLHKKDKRDLSDVGSPEAGLKGRRTRSPRASTKALEGFVSTDELKSPVIATYKHAADFGGSRSPIVDEMGEHVPDRQHDRERVSSPMSIRSDSSIHAIIRTPDQVRSASGQSFRSSGTPPLRRVDRSASQDLRGASKLSKAKGRAKASEVDPELDINIPSSSTYDPRTDKGKHRADMADVYEGWGDVPGQSPMSPTRPPSMRKRQSMHLLDLEQRIDQLVSENRLLASQKLTAERSAEDQARDHGQQRHAYEVALQEHKTFLAQKDAELIELKQVLEEWQSKVTHLTEVHNELTSSRGRAEDQSSHYRDLEAEHVDLVEQHRQLSTGMESIVQHEVASALDGKNAELRHLRDELENAKQQVRNLQQQLLASRASDDFIERDDDYFDGQCQALCQHVQQWVLRFSKFSDMKACYRANEVHEEKVVDRMDNALLDGTDFDEYLQDRIKRRDVFMSVVMTMIWEFIFTRYLFGMDREQRQKLKNLEKTLQEVGPVSAVHKWRATTLTLLMKRQSFEEQRATDTEAVVHEIYDTLAAFLPPPSHLISQIQDSLRKVINAAVSLAIEMRTQRADYQMLPPLVPEYDTHGDLVGKVRFNALTMNERSGTTTSNEALEEQEAVVRIVLFPLVVRTEEDDEQIVVCPAQVLTAGGGKGKKSVRVMSAQGGRSEASFAGSDVQMEGGMI